MDAIDDVAEAIRAAGTRWTGGPDQEYYRQLALAAIHAYIKAHKLTQEHVAAWQRGEEKHVGEEDDFPYADFEQNGIRVLRGEELQATLGEMSDGPFLEGPIEARGPIRSGQDRLTDSTGCDCG